MMEMQGNTTEIDERNLLRLDALKQGRKPELTIFTSKKRTFPQAFSVRKSVVQAVEKFLQKENFT